jgi:serine/threonine protein kinase
MKAASSIEYTVGEPMPGTKWVVRGKLGQGGMGLVLDVVKGHLIQGAMKVLLPSFAKVPEFAERFLGEVKVTARLQHPNIVQVLDFDRLEDGTPFMVMERLRGRTRRAARDQASRQSLDRGEHVRGGRAGGRGPLSRALACSVDRSSGRQAREPVPAPNRIEL